jgi:hypothetical protein
LRRQWPAPRAWAQYGDAVLRCSKTCYDPTDAAPFQFLTAARRRHHMLGSRIIGF